MKYEYKKNEYFYSQNIGQETKNLISVRAEVD
jgi:hypothetical protein